MTRRLHPALGLAAAALLAACGQNAAGDPYADATPDAAGLVLETSGSPNDGLALAGADGPAPTATAAAALAACQPYQWFCGIQQGIAGLNTYVRALVGPVEQMVKLPYTSPAPDVRVYGPIDVAGVGTFKLTVKKASDALYRWKLEAKKLGAPDADYQIVLAGQMVPGLLPHRGHGLIGIDLDALASALNPAAPGAPVFKGAGKILAGFAHVGDQKAVAYLLKGFVPDVTAAGASPIDLAFVGHKLADGRTRVRLAGQQDFVTTTAAVETLISRAGWWPGKGGRAAVAIGGGDLPAGHVFLALSCFNAAESEVYRDLFDCTLAGCSPVPEANLPDPAYRVGTPALCALGTDLHDENSPPPETAKDSTASEPGAPATPDAPPADFTSLKF
ncbi:MAG TPA: hypothetical protein VH880_05540 [Anaeromyxobacteraceae bacterium]|jgi:hypothetical protein